MGCTGERTYEEAVQYEMKRYINSFNLSAPRKKEITDYVNQDIKRKSAALQNYQYIYREEDVKQTLEDYKILIWERFNVGNRPHYEFYDEPIKEENKEKKIHKPKKEKKEKIKDDDSDSGIENNNIKIENNKENNGIINNVN